MVQLSFIIPAYNAQSTMERTLNSIYALKLDTDKFEVIVVDDCSTDSTRRVVDDYATKVGNLKVLYQAKNHRQGAARNRGVKNARGQYIMFVDADDKVEDGVPAALEQALVSGVDVLFCNYVWMYSRLEEELRKLPLDDGFITSGREFAENYYDTIVNTCPCCYLWKRDYLSSKAVPFVEDRQMEDFDFIEKNIYYAGTIGYCSSVIYRVLTYENLSSTTHTVTFNTVADWIHVGYRRMLFCDEIQHNAPTFCAKITDQSRCFISSGLSYRRLTRFTLCDVCRIFMRVGREEMVYFYEKGGWTLFNRLCMKHQFIIIVLTGTSHPLAECGRFLVRSIKA